MSPLASTRSGYAVAVEIDPGVAPAGEVRAEGRGEARARVCERARRLRWRAPEDGVRLAARVADEQVGAAVAVVVGAGDAHAGVRVGDAVRARARRRGGSRAPWVGLRAARPGDVHVQAVRILVVGDVEVGPAVAVDVREHRAEAVLDASGRARAAAPTSRNRACPWLSGPSLRKSRSRTPDVVRREARGRARDRGVHVGVARRRRGRAGRRRSRPRRPRPSASRRRRARLRGRPR